jgi:hypothetical protein
MKSLRDLANAGASVVVLHHCSKANDSEYRGSSDIAAGADVMVTLKSDSRAVTLELGKNRIGPLSSIRISPNFEQGLFELSQDPREERTDGTIVIKTLIANSPGITSSKIAEAVNMRKERVCKLLQEGEGHFWFTKPGPRRSKCFFVLTRSGIGNSSESPEH